MTDAKSLERLRHIAVEGPIGAGKTTLARLLAARIGAELMLEQPAREPVPRPLLRRRRAATRSRPSSSSCSSASVSCRGMAQSSMFEQAMVSDFMFAKDALFAQLNLSDEEYRLYAQMHQPIAAQLGEPQSRIRPAGVGAVAARPRARPRRGDGARHRPRLPAAAAHAGEQRRRRRLQANDEIGSPSCATIGWCVCA